MVCVVCVVWEVAYDVLADEGDRPLDPPQLAVGLGDHEPLHNMCTFMQTHARVKGESGKKGGRWCGS